MALYNLANNALIAGYNVYGEPMEYIYDFHGRELADITIMSFNIQRFSGINAIPWLLDRIFSTYNPDIVGFQEYDTTSTISDVTLTSFLGNYWKHLEVGDTRITNYTKAVASNLELFDPSTVFYTVYSESRSYQKMYVNVGEKRIAIFHTHLDYDYEGSPNTPKARQIKELYDACTREEYFVAFGDFNTVCTGTSDPDYINMIQQFVDVGCNCANCSDQYGFCGTWTDGTTETNGSWEQTDNIITSPNIKIKKVIIDKTKIMADTGKVIDHLPIIAYLEVH